MSPPLAVDLAGDVEAERGWRREICEEGDHCSSAPSLVPMPSVSCFDVCVSKSWMLAGWDVGWCLRVSE